MGRKWAWLMAEKAGFIAEVGEGGAKTMRQRAAVGGAKRAKLHLYAEGAGMVGLGVGLLRWAGL